MWQCIFYVFIKNLFVAINCIGLKPTFGIIVVLLQGDSFMVKSFGLILWKPCYNGRSTILILMAKGNGKQFKDRYYEIQCVKFWGMEAQNGMFFGGKRSVDHCGS